jgi:hypothetical protein
VGHIKNTEKPCTGEVICQQWVWQNTVVPWFASVLQHEQKCLLNFDFIYEWCFAIRVLPSVTWSQAACVVGNRLACSVSVGISHSYSQHSC